MAIMIISGCTVYDRGDKITTTTTDNNNTTTIDNSDNSDNSNNSDNSDNSGSSGSSDNSGSSSSSGGCGGKSSSTCGGGTIPNATGRCTIKDGYANYTFKKTGICSSINAVTVRASNGNAVISGRSGVNGVATFAVVVDAVTASTTKIDLMLTGSVISSVTCK